MQRSERHTILHILFTLFSRLLDDPSRVKLSIIHGSPYDDYINANYMPVRTDTLSSSLSHCFSICKHPTRQLNCSFLCSMPHYLNYSTFIYIDVWNTWESPRKLKMDVCVLCLGWCFIWQGYNSRKEFIAAQGPLPTTVNEFWRMIWEKNVQTLVMLTRCNEQGRVSANTNTAPSSNMNVYTCGNTMSSFVLATVLLCVNTEYLILYVNECILHVKTMVHIHQHHTLRTVNTLR